MLERFLRCLAYATWTLVLWMKDWQLNLSTPGADAWSWWFYVSLVPFALTLREIVALDPPGLTPWQALKRIWSAFIDDPRRRD